MATRMTQSAAREPHPGSGRLHQPQFVFKRIISSSQLLLMRLISETQPEKRLDGLFYDFCGHSGRAGRHGMYVTERLKSMDGTNGVHFVMSHRVPIPLAGYRWHPLPPPTPPTPPLHGCFIVFYLSPSKNSSFMETNTIVFQKMKDWMMDDVLPNNMLIHHLLRRQHLLFCAKGFSPCIFL